MLNPKEKRKENKKYQFMHNTVIADRERKKNKARKLYLHKRICLIWEQRWRYGWRSSPPSARLIALTYRYFLCLQVFFLGFCKEGFKVIVPDLVNSPSPPRHSPDWFLNLLEEKLFYRCCDGCRQKNLFVRGAKYKNGGHMFLYC